MKHSNWQRLESCELYVPCDNPQRLVLFNPGWLGEGTVTKELIVEAVDDERVAMGVVHPFPTKRPVSFHQAAESAVAATGIRDIEVVGHSLGFADVMGAIEYQQKYDHDYKVVAITALDGVATNGKRVDPRAWSEAWNMARGGKKMHSVVWKSFGNAARHPIHHLYEAHRAFWHDDLSDFASVCIDAGVRMTYVFHNDDKVVKEPKSDHVEKLMDSGINVDFMKGSHLTAVCEPETLYIELRAA